MSNEVAIAVKVFGELVPESGAGNYGTGWWHIGEAADDDPNKLLTVESEAWPSPSARHLRLRNCRRLLVYGREQPDTPLIAIDCETSGSLLIRRVRKSAEPAGITIESLLIPLSGWRSLWGEGTNIEVRGLRINSRSGLLFGLIDDHEDDLSVTKGATQAFRSWLEAATFTRWIHDDPDAEIDNPEIGALVGLSPMRVRAVLTAKFVKSKTGELGRERWFFRLKADAPRPKSLHWSLPALGGERVPVLLPEYESQLFEISQSQDLRHWERSASEQRAAAADELVDTRWWQFEVRKIFAGEVAAAWNTAVAKPYFNALHTISDDAAVSAVPLFHLVRGPDRWTLRLPSVTESGGKLQSDDSTARIQFTGTPQSARAEFPGLVDQNGFTLLSDLLIAGTDPTVPWNALFEFALTPDDSVAIPAANHLLRLGSLDLVMDGALVDREGQFKIAARLRTERSAPRAIELSLEADFSVTGVAPGGQDPLPDETRAGAEPTEAAVIVRLEDIDETSNRLSFTEKTANNRSRDLTLELLSKDTGRQETPRQPVVVLDRNPFLVAEVEVPGFEAAPSGSKGAVFARWRLSELEGRRWEVAGLDDKDGYRMRLPSQAVGEEMEKGDHAYISFGEEGDVTTYPLRPLGHKVGNMEQGTASDFRLSPTTVFQLRASYYDQRFVEPPWNTRRVLGYPGQRAPGVGVANMRFELLYGLNAKVDAAGLRLANLEARMGAVPTLPPEVPPNDPREELESQAKAYIRLRQSWARRKAEYRARLGVLTPYAEGRREQLELEQGLQYELRQTDAVDPVAPHPEQYLDYQTKKPTEPSDKGFEIGKRAFFGGPFGRSSGATSLTLS